MLRENAGWLPAGLVAAAALLSVTACGGGSTDAVTGGSISFRQVTPAPCGEMDSMRIGKAVVYFPAGSTSRTLIVDFPPGENQFHIIEWGDSQIWIGIETGEILKWDVAPQDEGCFRRIAHEPLEEAGH